MFHLARLHLVHDERAARAQRDGEALARVAAERVERERGISEPSASRNSRAWVVAQYVRRAQLHEQLLGTLEPCGDGPSTLDESESERAAALYATPQILGRRASLARAHLIVGDQIDGADLEHVAQLDHRLARRQVEQFWMMVSPGRRLP